MHGQLRRHQGDAPIQNDQWIVVGDQFYAISSHREFIGLQGPFLNTRSPEARYPRSAGRPSR